MQDKTLPEILTELAKRGARLTLWHDPDNRAFMMEIRSDRFNLKQGCTEIDVQSSRFDVFDRSLRTFCREICEELPPHG